MMVTKKKITKSKIKKTTVKRKTAKPKVKVIKKKIAKKIATKKKTVKKIVKVKSKKTIKSKPKKKVTKKSVKKKIIKKKARVEDKFVVSELAFYSCDNSVYYSLKELSNGLENMSNDTFNFHVNDLKNDFKNWIKYVYKELELSRSVSKAKDAKDMKRIIKSFI